jgi:hypothetical protein
MKYEELWRHILRWFVQLSNCKDTCSPYSSGAKDLNLLVC